MRTLLPTSRVLAALTMLCAAPAFATPVSATITGTTTAGAPMSGLVTYDDSLAGPCRYYSCIATGPTYVDLTIGVTRYEYGDLAFPGTVQIGEDRNFVDVGVQGATGRVAELTLWRASQLWGVAPGDEHWQFDTSTVRFAGPLLSFTPTALRLPPSRVPEPASGALLAAAVAASGFATRRASARCRRTTTLPPIGTRRSQA